MGFDAGMERWVAIVVCLAGAGCGGSSWDAKRSDTRANNAHEQALALTIKASDAAAAGDCNRVVKLQPRVYDNDAEVYATKFRTDPGIDRCLSTLRDQGAACAKQRYQIFQSSSALTGQARVDRLLTITHCGDSMNEGVRGRNLLWEMTRNAALAAELNDCATVTSIAAEVRRRDPRMHDDVFAIDAGIRKCLTPPPTVVQPTAPPATP